VPYGIHATVDPVKSAGTSPAANCLGVEPSSHQLGVRNETFLLCPKLRAYRADVHNVNGAPGRRFPFTLRDVGDLNVNGLALRETVFTVLT
jgi:hypothetical protein